jgi:type II secretory pathway component PulF
MGRSNQAVTAPLTSATSSQYRYRAVLPDGSSTSGEIFAESPKQALDSLQDRGWYPLDIRATRTLARGKRSLPPRDLALGLRVLATLLDAGLSMNKTLAAFADLAPESWKACLVSVTEAVRNGKPLADALTASPLTFPPVVIGILRAGEAGSGIAPAVLRAADIVERGAATRRAVLGALAYPALLAVTGSLSMVLLVGVVLPRFAEILAGLNQTLPRTTRIVLGAAALIRTAAVPSLLLMVFVFASWVIWTKTERGRTTWHAFLFRVPFIGGVRRSASTARATAALASLLESGVPLASALPYAGRASGDAAAEKTISLARERIVHGERPSVALRSAGSLTPTAVRLVGAGEESGCLARMLDHAAMIEASRTEQSVRAAVRLLEPLLILLFGGAIALVAAALLQAVYSLRVVG